MEKTDDRVRSVAANLGYVMLKRRIVDDCEEVKAAYEEAYISGFKLSLAENYLIRTLARLYVYILAFRSMLDEEQRKQWDEAVEYRLNLHDKCYRERIKEEAN